MIWEMVWLRRASSGFGIRQTGERPAWRGGFDTEPGWRWCHLAGAAPSWGTVPPGVGAARFRWASLGEPEGEVGRAAAPEPRDGESYHVPVLADEVVEWMAPAPGKLLVDGTFGGGGHTRRLLAAGASVLALDRDDEAMANAEAVADEWPDTFAAVRSRFDEFPAVLEEAGVSGVDGLLLDIGVSSRQLDCGARGFSLRQAGPLDMRMDRSCGITAAELVNTWPEAEIARILWENGEERDSRRVAAAIVRRRAVAPLRTTEELAELVAGVVPRKGAVHPATKTFQAIRMEVNDELGCLRRALEAVPRWLRPGGRLVVITFHSLEDRLVKQFMRRHSEPEIDRPEWPAPRPNPECFLRLPLRRSLSAGEAELRVNPRARSARLRVAERLP